MPFTLAGSTELLENMVKPALENCHEKSTGPTLSIKGVKKKKKKKSTKPKHPSYKIHTVWRMRHFPKDV